MTPPPARLLIVEDDASFARTLTRSFERRGHVVTHAASHAALVAMLPDLAIDHAVVDLKLDGASGLVCIRTLKAHDPAIRIVVLTGYASIATAVEAIKLGASHYLIKPSDTDDIERALGLGEATTPEPAVDERRSTIKTLEWERIHKTLAEADFNISETARRLRMHRRTLARKLNKRPMP